MQTNFTIETVLTEKATSANTSAQLANFRIEMALSEKGKEAEKIMRALPDWFGIEEAILNYRADVERQPTAFALAQNRDKIGFVCLKQHNQFTCEIQVMAVLPAFRRSGVGTALVKYAETYAQEKGCEFLEVKTVGASRWDPYYEQTRQFYLKMGFRPVEELTGIWDGNPCLIMVRSLANS